MKNEDLAGLGGAVGSIIGILIAIVILWNVFNTGKPTPEWGMTVGQKYESLQNNQNY
ncbi:MAG: hypothetical protein GY880_30660 [Planctomycetaceae bacterium]|nr:hypothetical protein [Planctomycetaceae bacterium]